MKDADPRTGKLLRWYPRAWRERYGEEFLALIQDSLDGRRPTWRLRLGVAWAGLCERCYHAARAVKSAAERPAVKRWRQTVVVGFLVAAAPVGFKAPIPPARTWQATAAFDLLLATGTFTAASALAGALVAVPAWAGFLQAGGWPKIRRRIAWAAGASVAAVGGLAGLLVAQRSMSFGQLSHSWDYFIGVLATWLPTWGALGLWAFAFSALGRDLKLAPRARAAEVVLGAVAGVAASATVSAYLIWYFTVQFSAPWLLVAVGGLALTLVANGPPRIRRAVRRRRRILAAAGRGR
jgi:hypothetical protein